MNEAIDRFIAVALRKNATIDVMNHPTGQHGFDFRDDNERTREILARCVRVVSQWTLSGTDSSALGGGHVRPTGWPPRGSGRIVGYPSVGYPSVTDE